MPKNEFGRIRRLIFIAGIMVISILVGMKLVFVLGTGDGSSGLKIAQTVPKPAIRNGLLHFQTDNTVEWNLPKASDSSKLVLTIRLRCRWIGQIFFSAGSGETYLLFEDAREFVPGKPFALDFVFEQGKMAMAIAGSKNPLRIPVDSPVPPQSFVIRSNQSDFVVESIRLIDKDTNKTLAFDDFGPDFKPVTVIAVGLIIALFFFVACWVDGRLLHRVFGKEPTTLASSFTTAALPVAFAFLLLDQVSFENLIDDLVFCCAIYRLAMAYGLGGKTFSGAKEHVSRVVYLGFTGGGVAFFTYFLYSIHLARTPLQIAFTAGAAALAATALALIFRRVRLDKELDWFGYAAFLWLFPALGNLVIFYVDDEDAIAPICYFIAFYSVVAGFRILSLMRAKIKYYQIFALGFALLSIVLLEGALRVSPYEARFRPLNIGKIFAEDELLFWVPKTLFEDEVTHQPVDDFEVRKVKFRSGTASKKKPSDVFRILVLGGSNTWGQWVDDPALVWPTQMEKKLRELLPDRKFEVINGGVRAYNLFQLLVLYKHYLSDYELDMIILYVNINDRSAYERKGMYTYRELYDLRSKGELKQVIQNEGKTTKSPKSEWIAATQKKLQKFTLYNALTKVLLSFRSSRIGQKFDPGLAKSLNPIEDYNENLVSFVRIGKKKNIRIILADEFTYFGDDVENKHDEFQDAMKSVSEKLKIPFFPVHDTLAQNYTRYSIVFPWDTVHLNKKGHRALGERFAVFLVKENLLTNN